MINNKIKFLKINKKIQKKKKKNKKKKKKIIMKIKNNFTNQNKTNTNHQSITLK